MKQPSRVLVVDDKETARESLQLLLFGFDCVFTDAEDGKQALELVQTNEFDVTFLDLKLPDMHGLDVLREARKLNATLGKVIIVTALPDPQTQLEASRLGAFRYLTKLNYEEIRGAFADATSDTPRPPHPSPQAEVLHAFGGALESRRSGDIDTTLPRLLVLDDSKDWLDTMQDVLKSDFDLSQTTDIGQAYLWAEKHTFDLVILDMQLPGGVSGLDVLSQMRKTSPDLRAIILTAYPDYGTALESGRRGAIAYVSKGEPATLNSTVKRILNEKRPPIRVFLSYERRDQERVAVLYDDLMGRGFLPWMDIKSILPGRKWKVEIRKAIDRCDRFVFCLSRNSLFKEGTMRNELVQALERKKGMLDEHIFFITARLEDCMVEEPISEFQFVDLFSDDGLPKLIQALSSDGNTDF